MQRFTNRTVLVVGASSGIGRAAAAAFAREGARVAIAARRRRELDALADEIARDGGEVLAIPTDVARPEQVESLVATVAERFGALDCAFNNAGVEGRFAPLVDLDADAWMHAVDVNLRAVWLAMKHEVSVMRAQGRGGAIVNTSSWLSTGALPGASLYAATKGGVDAMMRPVALEAAPHGIRVNNVNPGYIHTPMFDRLADADSTPHFARQVPLGRLGTPDDVADVVLWLCSDASRYVTGQCVVVDGGLAIPGQRGVATTSA